MEVDSNHRSKLQQIYSLSPLATRESIHMELYSIKPMIGLEPTTFAVTGRRSNQLSHWAIPEDNNLYLQNRTLKLYLLYLNLHPFPIQNLWSSPRPISKCQLNTLLCLHLIPIYLVVFKGSYSCLLYTSSAVLTPRYHHLISPLPPRWE